MGDLVLREIRLDLGAGDLQHRPHDPPAHAGDAAQPGGAAAAGEVEEQGLGQIVQRVGRDDRFAAEGVRRAFEEIVAQRAPRLLEPEAVRRGVGGHVGMLRHIGDAVFPAEALHKGGVAPGFRAPDAVLEMGGGHIEALRDEQMQQAHGVGPAGDGGEQPFARDQLTVQLNTRHRAASPAS